jgi:hypothetical protein
MGAKSTTAINDPRTEEDEARGMLEQDVRPASGGRAGEMWPMASLLLLEYKDAIQ